jgi:hypothetical protein
MMKTKILLLFGLAAATVSCVRIETMNGDGRIGFDTYALRTKAGSSYIGGNGNSQTNIPNDSKFGVFAYFHPGDASTETLGQWNNSNVNSNYSNLMLNQWVQRQEPTQNTYGYYYPTANSRYWPNNIYDRISFFAYYPYAANAFIADENAESDGTGITLLDPVNDYQGYSENPVGFPKFRFVVNPDASQQVDFMISDMCLNQSKKAGVLTGGNDKVQFTFHHMLSQIRIKQVDFELENDDVTISDVEFKFLGVPKSGIVTPSIPTVPSPIGTGHAAMRFTWSGLNSSNSEFTTTIYRDTDTDAQKQAAVMLMIPHTFSSDPGKDIAQVTFTVTRAENAYGEHYTYSGNLSTSLASGGLTGWEPNKIYNYTIRITLNSIEFSAQVEAWPEASTDVNTINVELENQ